MTNAIEDYLGPLPEGWAGGQAVQKWWRGGIVHLYKLTKLCAECGAEMRIDVTKHALIGTAKNAGLHLKRCATCRARSKALNTSSRPHVEGEPPPKELQKHAFTETAPATEPATADTMIATMKDELAGLYAQNKELRERLVKYEPEPRMPWE